MKYFRSRLILVALIALPLCVGYNRQAAAQAGSGLTLQVFYDALSPFGDWVYDNRYGYVWVPAETDFHPYYTNGYWEMTVYGSTWISLYPWGWAPFHYGRWTYDPFYGWIWLPGYQWAPAWVCWRYGGGLYGWAPLGPNFIIHVGFGNYGCPYNWWIFAPQHYVYGPHHSSHYHRNTDPQQVRTGSVIGRTGTDNGTNTLYPVGPSPEDVRNATGQEINIRETHDVPTPDLALPAQTSVNLYRPVPVRVTSDKPMRPARFLEAPQPIREDQPVITRGSIQEYKQHMKAAPETTRQQDIKNERQNITPKPEQPVRRIQNERHERPVTPVRPAQPQRTEPSRQQRVQPAQQRSPGTTPVRQQPVRRLP